MPNDPKSDQPSKKSGRKFDELTLIKGIGDALEQWFRESFKVRTFADLAALSAEEVESRAREEGRQLSLSKIQQILAQARELTGTLQPTAPELFKSAKGKGDKTPSAPQIDDEWNDFALFSVFFERKVVGGKEEKRTTIERRTRIHHRETSEQESWPGIETEQACRWMLQKLGKEGETIDEEGESEKTPQPIATFMTEHSVSEPVILKVTDIQIFQEASSNQPQELYAGDRVFTGFVKAEKPFSFSVTFQLSGPGAAEVIKSHTEYSVVFDAHEIFSSKVTKLGVAKPDLFKAGQFSYTAALSPLTLSTGAYRLEILTTARDGKLLWDRTIIPLFQVI